jgi:hypothetical protein
MPLHAWQGSTPQAALEEMATATKPEAIARHLPGPVQEKIEVLPRLQKQQILDYILKLKISHLRGCTIQPAHASDGWEIFDAEGAGKGTVTISNAFISGVDAILPLQITVGGDLHVFIVTMHLEGDEWRLDDFGPWEKTDLALGKLLHQPTEIEDNDADAQQTLWAMARALDIYARAHPRIGYPSSVGDLTSQQNQDNVYPRTVLLDESFAAEPLIKHGYRFRYLHTGTGSGDSGNLGLYEIIAAPVEFGKTGTKNYFLDQRGIYATSENRPATKDDPAPED